MALMVVEDPGFGGLTGGWFWAPLNSLGMAAVSFGVLDSDNA